MTKQEQSFLMAKRLKDLREKKGLSCAGLRNALYEQYGITISRDSLMSYEIQTEPHSKIKDGKYPNLNMGVEYLNAFAKFYGVSTDFLLGLIDPDNSTADEKLRMISEYTGLSNEAIQELHDSLNPSILTAYKKRFSYLGTSARKKWCNYLLTSGNFMALSIGLSCYEDAFAKSTVEKWKYEKEDKEAAGIRFSLGEPSFDEAKCAVGWRLSEIVHRMTEDLEKNFSVNDEAFIEVCIDLIKDETERKDFFEYAKSRNENER